MKSISLFKQAIKEGDVSKNVYYYRDAFTTYLTTMRLYGARGLDYTRTDHCIRNEVRIPSFITNESIAGVHYVLFRLTLLRMMHDVWLRRGKCRNVDLSSFDKNYLGVEVGIDESVFFPKLDFKIPKEGLLPPCYFVMETLELISGIEGIKEDTDYLNVVNKYFMTYRAYGFDKVFDRYNILFPRFSTMEYEY